MSRVPPEYLDENEAVGRREDPATIPRRIASLLPSATEIVCALGLGNRLVLRSHECDFPPWVDELPFATSPKYEPDGTSYQIDERIRALIQEGLSVYRVNAMALRRASPQVIVTQDHCEVCAVPAEAIHSATATLIDPAPEIVSLSPTALEEILGDFRRVARALGVPARGDALATQVGAAMAKIEARVRNRSGVRRPRVLTIEWMDPLMAAGNWVPELVEMAGGTNLMGKSGQHSPVADWESMRALDPEVIVVVPCGYELDRTRSEVGTLRGLPGWEDLAAVRGGRVALADGHHYFNRPGPRIPESLEILVEIVHPELEHSPERLEGSRSTRWAWLDG